MQEKRYYYITPEDYKTAKENKISKSTLYRRVSIYGWDVDRAITTPINENCRPKGIWMKWKDKSVVCYSTFATRIRAGWSPKRAALTPALKKVKVND